MITSVNFFPFFTFTPSTISVFSSSPQATVRNIVITASNMMPNNLDFFIFLTNYYAYKMQFLLN